MPGLIHDVIRAYAEAGLSGPGTLVVPDADWLKIHADYGGEALLHFPAPPQHSRAFTVRETVGTWTVMAESKAVFDRSLSVTEAATEAYADGLKDFAELSEVTRRLARHLAQLVERVSAGEQIRPAHLEGAAEALVAAVAMLTSDVEMPF